MNGMPTRPGGGREGGAPAGRSGPNKRISEIPGIWYMACSWPVPVHQLHFLVLFKGPRCGYTAEFDKYVYKTVWRAIAVIYK